MKAPKTIEEFLALPELPQGAEIRKLSDSIKLYGKRSKVIWALTDNSTGDTWRLVRVTAGYRRQRFPNPRRLFREALRGRLPDTKHP